jgi:hypothetical protein
MSHITRERLEKTLARVARELDLDQERLRRWVSFLALSGVLERAIQERILTDYYRPLLVIQRTLIAKHVRYFD